MDSTEQTSSSESVEGGEPQTSRPKDRVHWGAYVAVAVGSALLSAAATTTLLWLTGTFDREVVRITEVVEVTGVVEAPAPETPSTSPDATPTPTPPLSELILTPPDGEVRVIGLVADVAARATPSIVTVQSFGEDLARIGSGSGVIFRSDGFIVTNDHVIDGADTLKAIMSDGLSYPATIVGTDPLMDIAVLKVEAKDLVAIEFGAMEGVRTGEPAIAVGNPLGLDGGPSITAGVISAFDRSLVTNVFTGESLYGLLQTDAPSPGAPAGAPCWMSRAGCSASPPP